MKNFVDYLMKFVAEGFKKFSTGCNFRLKTTKIFETSFQFFRERDS